MYPMGLTVTERFIDLGSGETPIFLCTFVRSCYLRVCTVQNVYNVLTVNNSFYKKEKYYPKITGPPLNQWENLISIVLKTDP